MAITYQHLVHTSNGDTEIVGRGLRVYTILACKRSGERPEDIADDYELPVAAVYEALAYAADHANEMDAIDERNQAAEEWILKQSLRRP